MNLSDELIVRSTQGSAIAIHEAAPDPHVGYQLESEKNAINGYAGLDGIGKVAAAQLPSYVDDVLEYADLAAFPGTGETGKIYVALDTKKIYRWSGSIYIEISPVIDADIDHGSIGGLADDDHIQYLNDVRGDARYYTETELDAAPVAAGAKVDKIVGTDNAILRSDGILGAIQDSPKSTISDTGVVSFDTASRIADAPTFSILNNGSSVFEIILATGAGGVARITGDATDKDALFFAESYDATGKASVIVGRGGVGAITMEADLGGSTAKIENTVTGPFTISNASGLLRFEVQGVIADMQLDLGSNDGATKVAVRDSDDAEVATIDSDGTITGSGLGLGGVPGASAIFQADSITKGLLPPRMTSAQRDAIGSPASGLLLFDTTNNILDLYNGTAWRQFITSPAATLEIGGIVFATGGCCVETDSANLFWDNATKRLGIGTATPNATLDVTGLTPGNVGGFPAGVFQVTSPNAAVNASAVITGHNSFGGNKQLWYLGSSSSSNDNVTLRNRQNGSLTLSTNDLDRVTIQGDGKIGMGLTPTVNMAGLSIEAGRLTIKETTTPTADADYGKVYCKNDNKLYFQDGAGVEHEVGFV